jgi:hypothetical protein
VTERLAPGPATAPSGGAPSNKSPISTTTRLAQRDRHPSFDRTWTSSTAAPAYSPALSRQAGRPRRGQYYSSGATDQAHKKSQYCYVDVHWSSGPANRAFWLMSKGLGCKGEQSEGRPAAIGECLGSSVARRCGGRAPSSILTTGSGWPPHPT